MPQTRADFCFALDLAVALLPSVLAIFYGMKENGLVD
jgi:hypothetical protein